MCTLSLVFASFAVAATIDMNYRVFGISLIAGWLPLLIVALRRPRSPSRADHVAMFAGFPIVFAIFAVFDKLYFQL